MNIMDKPKASGSPNWILTSESSQWRQRHQAKRPDGSLHIEVEITCCMGDTERKLSIWCNDRRILCSQDPCLKGVAFSSDFGVMVLRGGAEVWYDTTGGNEIVRPDRHDIANEVLLLDLLPQAFEQKDRSSDPAARFLLEIVDAERHDAIQAWDGLRSQEMVRAMLARTPGEYSSERELEGILVLFKEWKEELAEQTFEEVRTALETWPASHVRAPSWFDWRTPSQH